MTGVRVDPRLCNQGRCRTMPALSATQPTKLETLLFNHTQFHFAGFWLIHSLS